MHNFVGCCTRLGQRYSPSVNGTSATLYSQRALCTFRLDGAFYLSNTRVSHHQCSKRRAATYGQVLR